MVISEDNCGLLRSCAPGCDQTGVNSDAILTILNEQGYWVSNRAISQSVFRQIADGLGPVLRATDIRIQDSAYRSQTAGELDFHTDSVDARFVGWWCVCQSEPPVATRLLDGHDLMRHLSFDDVDTLSTLRVPGVPIPGRPARTTTVLDRTAGRLVLNVHDNLERRHPEHAALWSRLRSALASAQSNSVAIALEPGQCLFVDNHRFLHARGKLPANSSRWLKRLWIGAR